MGPEDERQLIAKAIAELGLGAYQERLLADLERSIRVHRASDASHDLPVGSSKLGGAPDLPRGFDWPTWETTDVRDQDALMAPGDDHRRLQYLGQINLSDLPAGQGLPGFPPSGLLSFLLRCE